MKIFPATRLRGTLQLPGDKSISHRAAMLAAIAVGETRIENFSSAEDCRTTLKCLEQLGVSISQNGTDVVIKGVGKTGLQKPEQPLDCGNSGTTMRLLAGILAGQPFDSVLTGDESLSKRPMGRVIEPLTKMGAKIESENGSLPIRIFGVQKIAGIEYEPPIASAQVKSCILLAGLFADGKTTIIERTTTRDHTERMLQWFGVDLQLVKESISLNSEAILTAQDVKIPSDFSSAAYFIVAAACLEGSDITIRDLGLNPTRTSCLTILQHLNANAQILTLEEKCNEPVGMIRVRGRIQRLLRSTPHLLSGSIIPNIIDEIPILAVLGTQLDVGIEVRDAGELRHKESDRIASIVENLRRMNADIEEFPDGFRVEKSSLKGSVIDSFGDHRIAMACAVAGLLADGETEILNAECVNISFPDFFETLQNVVR